MNYKIESSLKVERRHFTNGIPLREKNNLNLNALVDVYIVAIPFFNKFIRIKITERNSCNRYITYIGIIKKGIPYSYTFEDFSNLKSGNIIHFRPKHIVNYWYENPIQAIKENKLLKEKYGVIYGGMERIVYKDNIIEIYENN